MCSRALALFAVLWFPAVAQHGSTAVVNPFTGPEDAAAGRLVFRGRCAGCHGPDGKGTGAGPSLASGTFRRGGSDEALYTTITKGVAGTSMPAYSLPGAEVWQLVTYVRSLALTRGAPLTRGDAQAGATIFRKSCNGCHAAGGHGPDLAGIAMRMTDEELRKSITEPDAAVAASFWTSLIQTTNGQKFRGTRLNEDTHSIQLLDEKGKLISVNKSDIAKAELIRKSSMPSFAGKLSAGQLDDVLAYLTQLKGDEQ